MKCNTQLRIFDIPMEYPPLEFKKKKKCCKKYKKGKACKKCPLNFA